MYTFLVHAHSGLRYLILLVAAVVIIKSLIGWLSKSSYAKIDKILAPSYVGLMHLQLLIGLILYFGLSPLVTYQMSDKFSRYWSVEHIAIMILAVVAAQVGRSISKKKSEDTTKFKLQTILFGSSLIIVLLGLATMPGRGIWG